MTFVGHIRTTSTSDSECVWMSVSVSVIERLRAPAVWLCERAEERQRTRKQGNKEQEVVEGEHL